jgi:predicted metal-dependent phosphoesterase TrpH
VDCADGHLQTAFVAIEAALQVRRVPARAGGGSFTEDRALGTIIDLHTHTTVGSSDSKTGIEDIARIRERVPALHGLALTEHVRRWPDDAMAQLPSDLLVFNEREFDTFQGHILVLGPPQGTHVSSVEQLRGRVQDVGGVMILAHPFRFYPSALSLLYPRAWHEPGEWPPERLAEHPLFGLVDAVEAWNARATPEQNELAEACARIRGLPVVAGSDSHAPEDVGRYATEFEDDIRTLDQLKAAVLSGRCRPVELTDTGEYRPQARPGLYAAANASTAR